MVASIWVSATVLPVGRRMRHFLPIICFVILSPFALANSAATGGLEQLKHMSLEELMDVEVTSVSRTEESQRRAAAAVSVVTGEIIRRSGATTVPDALRLVPGIHVGEQISSAWAVSARGFSSINSEKLLVLSDTRSIYTPLFSGVLWDVQDYLLQDIDRIEVIRGPGAALWGSNAVNGVINITTRSARDTLGTYLEAGTGTFDRAWLGVRYGSQTSGGASYRVFGQYRERGATANDIAGTDDDWRLGHLGFRADWGERGSDSFTVQGDTYIGDIGQLAPAVTIIGRQGPQPPLNADVSGGNLLARWRHAQERGDMQLRAYYDYTDRDDPSYHDTLHTFDIDLQKRFMAGTRHEVIGGVAYRLTDNRNRGGELFVVDPLQSRDNLFSGFIQDQISLANSVRLTLGTKLEHNDFSGFEWQPSVRLAWSPGGRSTLWLAASRAVRVPTRLERDVAIDATDPSGNPVYRLLGSDDFDAEQLLAYEAGYRWKPLTRLSFDLALFYNDYDRLASLELGEPFTDPDSGQVVIPLTNQNTNHGKSYGAELQLDWQPFENWILTATYSHVDLDLAAAGLDLNRGVWLEGSTPRNLAGLRSLLTLGGRLEVDAQLRYQSRIRSLPVLVTGEGIDAYSELDLRLGWQLSERWDLSLTGQNLLHKKHEEFGPPDQRGRIERAVHLRATWRN